MCNLTRKNTGNRFQPGNPHRFKPGQSGNPSGKPSEQRAVTLEVVKNALGQVDPKLGKTPLERIVEHTIRRALQGSYKDKKLLLNYSLGMPHQSMEVAAQFSLMDVVRKARERAQRPELPAVTPTNGHSDSQTAQAAAEMPERDLTADRGDDAERPAQPQPAGPIKRVVM